MNWDSLWQPRSSCDAQCLPEPGSVPRAGAVRVAARLVAATAVIACAVVTVPLVLPLSRTARGNVLRLLAGAVLAALGVRHTLRGRVPRRGALIVANHVSWLDVLVLLAHTPARLLAKREVRSWPVIGPLAAATGTVFVDRRRPRALPGTVAAVADALRAGDVVAVFPEGTTWCGRTGGHFRPAVFQAAVDAGAPVVPVALRFTLAAGSDTTVAAFLGEDTLLASLRRVVAVRGLHVVVQAHPALHPIPGASRRALARVAQSVVHGPIRGSWTRGGPMAPPTVQDLRAA
ncbi:1-acyl-sn-glycerol-3-phosphate acyltransferase [Planosporangium thailandense]|uniref:1-acyl-sn-glycerol-3-phosphate acyltransferase n=1 Tax=Planosporangium thailandense TaxID=765197 RepID=A0ABX0XYJ5_9ACTN|nr:lysophospholipid acyltransferase family protein [Planosporangium thailandense]NJC70901.1 1-acyl-sn-glycerol-3-phosphate acyltransferase [Planosporangium thailandense]